LEASGLAPDRIRLADDFQGGIAPFWGRDWMPAGGMRFVPDPAAPVGQALAITLHHGDCPDVGGDGERTERAELHELPSVTLPTETEVWYAVSLYLPRDFPLVDRRLVVGQWYQPSPDPRLQAIRSPLVANRFRAGVFSITRQDDSTRVVLFETPGDVRGRWLRLAYHLRFSHSGGRLEIWLDGQQVVDYAGPLAYPQAHDRVHFRLGLYRDHLPIPMTLLVRDFRRGADRRDVEPAAGQATA